jgi:uncharacterized protein (TIGR03435 family)
MKNRPYKAMRLRPAAHAVGKIAGVVSIAFFIGIYAAANLYGQNANNPTPNHAGPKFEVASIRESQTNSHSKNVGILYGQNTFHGTLFSVNAYLGDYVHFAYKTENMHIQWSLSTSSMQMKQYDIEARSTTTPTVDELRQMVKALLIERFKLKTHFVDSKKEVYYLSLDKPGVSGRGLVRHPRENDCSKQTSSADSEHKQEACGISIIPEDKLIRAKMMGVTLQELADKLPFMGLGPDFQVLPVVDRTGLQGLYDIQFAYGIEPPKGVEVAFKGETLLDTLKHQLGLKLVRGTATLPTLTVDHCEPPSAN